MKPIDSHNMPRSPQFSPLWEEVELSKFYSQWELIEKLSLCMIRFVHDIQSTSELVEELIDSWNTGQVPLIIPNHCSYDLSVLSHKLPEGAILGFLSSGATSDKPTITWKTKSALHSEALMLIHEFESFTLRNLCSLVPPVHIYGFLYGVLVPAILNCKLVGSLNWSRPMLPADLDRLTFDTLIMVPPQWSFVESILENHDVKLVISSGASFGHSRIERALHLKKRLERSFEIVDVLGSTETGGIGYRILTDGETLYRQFPGVDLFSPHGDDQAWSLSSPFTDHNRLDISDVFIHQPEQRTFEYLGRSDHVVKIGAKRYDIRAIENAFAKCAVGHNIACHFEGNASGLKGGRLLVFIEGRTVDTKQILENYKTEFLNLPLPERLILIERFPRGAMGKIVKSQLLALTKLNENKEILAGSDH